ncbi:hypothetical protein NQ318_011828 [Aromia moschata]|uniref:GIY-YIG domain-containing protein n=1 Tax=Aromia moschata TaxID=1265417 RepID=A0AAV8XQR9_9CUCU|nr:hypothetical protein NQ318_011828 [Aromia moschata]
MSRRRMFWEQRKDKQNILVADALSRDRIEFIMQNLHCCDNDQLDPSDKFIKVRPLFDKLNKTFQEYAPYWEQHNINNNLVYNSKNELQMLLGNPKDKIDNNEKSGIYEISCKNCDQKYIGHTKRSILTRFKEHMAHLKYGRTEKSYVAQYAFDNNHRIVINNLKLIRNVTNIRQLDAFESVTVLTN